MSSSSSCCSSDGLLDFCLPSCSDVEERREVVVDEAGLVVVDDDEAAAAIAAWSLAIASAEEDMVAIVGIVILKVE